MTRGQKRDFFFLWQIIHNLGDFWDRRYFQRIFCDRFSVVFSSDSCHKVPLWMTWWFFSKFGFMFEYLLIVRLLSRGNLKKLLIPFGTLILPYWSTKRWKKIRNREYLKAKGWMLELSGLSFYKRIFWGVKYKINVENKAIITT